MSKKRIIAIVAIVVLLLVAGISVGVFLSTRGETAATNGNEHIATPEEGDANEEILGDETTNGDEANGNENVDNENDATDEAEDNNIAAGNNQENDAGNAGITTDTNVNNVGETTITRVEEQERLVSENHLDWWQPMKVAVTRTKVGVNKSQITVTKSSTTGIGKDEFVYAGQNIVYTIKVTNNGNKDIKNIEITDKIPQNTTFVSIEDANIANKIVGTKKTMKTRNNVIGVKWIVTIPAGETVTAKFTVNVNKTMLDENGKEIETTGIIQNTARANGQESNEVKTTIIKPDQHKVEIRVPGKDAEEQHDEVILMVDGSYSLDGEWPAMKEAIIAIGKSTLNGKGNTQLTLMAFGMGDNEVLVHVKSVEELSAALGELPGTLLYGRSSTNCEAGFTGVEEYINNHDKSLNEAHVIYISDGNINTDETPYTFYNWKNNKWLKRTPATIAKMSLEYECLYILEGCNPSEAYKEIFGADANPEEVIENMTDEQALAWADLVWDAVYKNAGLATNAKYPVSDAERAFVTYDKQNNTHVQEAFYYALWGRSYPERWERTPKAAAKLAENAKVKTIYMIDYDTYSEWMDTGIKSEKENVVFVKSDGIKGLLKALEGIITNLSKTPLNDVVVTAYTSKWVNLDETPISIVDDTTGTIIYSTDQGWLIEEDKRPTSEETPIKIELVSENEYSNGGTDVEGNTNNQIHKITWHVKDGALLRTENYHIEYTVTEDIFENGFKYDSNYSVNGNTFIEYKDENGQNKKEEQEIILK